MTKLAGVSIWHRSERHPGVSFERPSRTKQEFTAECDINTLMARYNKTGVLSHVSRSAPRYLDLSDVPDLQMSMNIMGSAREAFMRLPAKVRATFDNDPVKFVDFAQNPENLDQLRKWELAPPAKPEPAPQKVEVVNAPPPRERPRKGAQEAAEPSE